MTPERLAEIEARFQAARPKEDRGGEELAMTVAQSCAGGAEIYYADNDLCAEVCSNIGLDANKMEIAEFFAHALVDVRDLIKAVKDLTPVARNAE